jgi:hypothetical protein
MTFQLLPVGWLNTKCGRGGSRPQLFSISLKNQDMHKQFANLDIPHFQIV